jgi:hypothetical protein
VPERARTCAHSGDANDVRSPAARIENCIADRAGMGAQPTLVDELVTAVAALPRAATGLGEARIVLGGFRRCPSSGTTAPA